MCRYSTINLSATECDKYRKGEAAHVYAKYSYWLCKDAKGNQPCARVSPREDQIGYDVGSRQGRCPVCDKISSANYEYKLAVQRATDKYNNEVNSAFKQKEDEVNNANYITEVVSSQAHEHHTRRHYSRSWD